jgi:hypothetical protein
MVVPWGSCNPDKKESERDKKAKKGGGTLTKENKTHGGRKEDMNDKQMIERCQLTRF